MRANKNMLLREVAGEYILIPTGETALKIHGMISLTESGCLLWNALQENCTVERLVECIISHYQVDRVTAEKDVDEFLHKMDQLGILEKEV